MFEEIEKKLNFSFKDKELLRIALIHKSYNEGIRKELPDNERLEFLGDSVINLVITDFLFRRLKTLSEGELSKLKSHLVSSDFLYKVSAAIGLHEFVMLGKGEEKNNGRQNKKIVASLFEAVVGSIYLDSNFRIAAATIIPFFKPHIDTLMEKEIAINDYKSELQELLQKHNNLLPEYRIIKEEGKPPQIEFTAAVFLNNVQIGSGKGKNKRQAEQNAALDALTKNDEFGNYEKLSEVFFFRDESL